MKTIFFLMFFIGILTSCQKRFELNSLDDFNVKTERSSYSVGDTVRFIFEGTPENIVFWSGENGSKYENRKRTAIEGNVISLSFKSFSQFGTADRAAIKLMISTDFSGTVDAANILKATWIDISEKAQWSAGTDQFPSGNINLDEFATQNKDMTFAFQHKTTALKPLAQQNRWVIRSFDVTSTNPELGTSATSVLTLANAGWKGYRFDTADPKTAWSITTAQLITGRSETELYNDWCISKLFNPNKVNPDKGAAIKNISTKLSSYNRVYPAAGTYKVVFVGTNGNVEQQRSVTREVAITVTN